MPTIASVACNLGFLLKVYGLLRQRCLLLLTYLWLADNALSEINSCKQRQPTNNRGSYSRIRPHGECKQVKLTLKLGRRIYRRFVEGGHVSSPADAFLSLTSWLRTPAKHDKRGPSVQQQRQAQHNWPTRHYEERWVMLWWRRFMILYDMGDPCQRSQVLFLYECQHYKAANYTLCPRKNCTPV